MTRPSTPTLVSIAALALAAVSLGLNVVLLQRLRHPERLAAPVLERALTRLADEDVRIPYTVRIPVGTPIHADVPVDESYRVRIDTRLPIDTRVRLALPTPLGDREVSVPVRADVPIRTTVPIRFRDTLELRTATRAEIVVPLEVRVRDLPLDALRRSLDS